MHFSKASALLVASSAVVLVSAQTYNITSVPGIECGPDYIVDDFATATFGYLPYDTVTLRALNLLKADYGSSATGTLNFTVDPTLKVMNITSISNTPTNNFFFSKFDAGACFNTTDFYAVGFDLYSPPGGAFTMTLTQKDPDCYARAPSGSDSRYVPISQYVDTSKGGKQSVVVPFSDYRLNTNGTAYDFVHLKDWTLNEFTPLGGLWQISNLRLIRSCKNNGPYGTNVTAVTKGPTWTDFNNVSTGQAGTTAGSATEVVAKSSAGNNIAGLATAFVSIFGAFLANLF
ncbi:hypothetical protein HKX48_008116 [Thoreauomyces humboldtii]|nr:hypothetical protein HKX48_008116 [Thoreauomyces humboldtii]